MYEATCSVRLNLNEPKSVIITILILGSCQRPAVGARAGEAGGLRGGRSADGHVQEGYLRGNAVLDGSGGHPAVRLRLQGKTPVYITANCQLHPRKGSGSYNVIGFKWVGSLAVSSC